MTVEIFDDEQKRRRPESMDSGRRFLFQLFTAIGFTNSDRSLHQQSKRDQTERDQTERERLRDQLDGDSEAIISPAATETFNEVTDPRGGIWQT
ncbi:hypothetical protein KOR42_32340 [Thalassoglobus neptunius]|uniref:Uncharacterized protein n=1 Tax=Thalassoglobus neptunius TaxID=1938619 RepID=A0A5C5WPA9_9PLAN|nr:hypothetical protein KOR42_32340 [Thalassoglobus neptunius]